MRFCGATVREKGAKDAIVAQGAHLRFLDEPVQYGFLNRRAPSVTFRIQPHELVSPHYFCHGAGVGQFVITGPHP